MACGAKTKRPELRRPFRRLYPRRHRSSRARHKGRRRGGPKVRIHLPAAARQSLSRSRFSNIENLGFSRRCARMAWRPGRQRRARLSISRQPAAISLSGHIFRHRSADNGSEAGPSNPAFAGLNGQQILNSDRAQPKPRTARCSYQARGRRECSRGFSAVRSRGCRPSRIAWVISGAR
jgi:hypothetical protein